MVAVTVAGILIGTIPHIAFGTLPRLETIGRRILVTAIAAALFRPLYTNGDLDRIPDRGWQLPALMMAIVLLAGIVDAILAALARAGRDHVPFDAAARDEFRALSGSAPRSRPPASSSPWPRRSWATGRCRCSLSPLLLTQFSFRRYATIEGTYLQTIRSLSKVTEVGGYTETGPLARVAGSPSGRPRDGVTERRPAPTSSTPRSCTTSASSRCTEPIPGGATTMVAPGTSGASPSSAPRSSARPACSTGSPRSSSGRPTHIVAHGGQLDAELPIESRIIKAVNAYDDLVGGSMDTERRMDALERLRGSMAFEYDPRVVETLTRVVDRTLLLNA